MTDQHLSSTARAPAAPNKPVGEADDVYAENGRIFLLTGGAMREVGRAEALHEAACLSHSPIPASQARADRIKAVLEETRDDYFFRAPRFGDLVVCPYCDDDTFDCDHCGGERRLYASEVFSGQCDSPLPPLIGGLGGKPRSPVESPRSTRTSPTPGSSRSAGSPTESGREARSFQPASGGSRAKSTPKPANSSPLKPAAAKSTGGPQTLGGHGLG